MANSGTCKLLIIAGARPNFMKVAPLIREIKNQNQKTGASVIQYRLIHTGQHYDANMSDVFFKELGIPAPDINLEVGSGSHAVQTAHLMLKFEPVCVQEKPDWVVVVGDVNSTVACTLVAAKLGIKVAHVEAGLRSFDRSMPEEINRLVTDALADLLLTPSEDGNENLRKEGVSESKIKLVGNIMIDSLQGNLQAAQQSTILQRLGWTENEGVYVTLHRPSNVDRKESLEPIIQSLKKLSTQAPIVFPMHPRTRTRLAEFNIEVPQGKMFQILDPIGYNDSLRLAQSSRFVLTDSGGLQEETTFFQTPCLTLRPNTERPITISMGSNRLTTIESLKSDIEKVLALKKPVGQIPPFWDGRTAQRILSAITKYVPS